MLYHEAVTMLQTAGNVAEMARLKRVSLTRDERDYIYRARIAGARHGMSAALVTAIEGEGAEIVRDALRCATLRG